MTETQSRSAPLNSTGLLGRLTPAKRHELIGELTTLLMASPLHRRLYLYEIAEYFLAALDHNQFRIYRRGGLCVGFVSWAYLTPEIYAKSATGNYFLKYEDWKAGDCLWVVDLIAPFGDGKMIIRELRNTVFPGQKGRYYRVRIDAKRRGLRIIRGSNAAADQT